MRLKVLLPTEIIVDEEVTKVVAEAANGSFCLLPRHVDFVAALIPGLLSFVSGGEERHIAVDEGILLKIGDEVRVSTERAVRGADLGRLRQAVREQFRTLNERERSARSAVAKLEAGFVRRFVELGGGHG